MQQTAGNTPHIASQKGKGNPPPQPLTAAVCACVCVCAVRCEWQLWPVKVFRLRLCTHVVDKEAEVEGNFA